MYTMSHNQQHQQQQQLMQSNGDLCFYQVQPREKATAIEASASLASTSAPSDSMDPMTLDESALAQCLQDLLTQLQDNPDLLA